MADEFALIGPGAVEIAAVNVLNVTMESEVIDDPAGKNRGLGGHHVERVALGFQSTQRIRDARIEVVLEYSICGETFSIQVNGLLDKAAIGGAEKNRKTFIKRWPDVVRKLSFGWTYMPQFFEGVSKAANDALTRIGEGAIEIEEKKNVWLQMCQP